MAPSYSHSMEASRPRKYNFAAQRIRGDATTDEIWFAELALPTAGVVAACPG